MNYVHFRPTRLIREPSLAARIAEHLRATRAERIRAAKARKAAEHKALLSPRRYMPAVIADADIVKLLEMGVSR